MNETIYQLIPVSNGFIVVLPYIPRSQWDGLQQVAETIKAKESGMPPPETAEKSRDERTFIFKELSEAVAFITLKIEGEL